MTYAKTKHFPFFFLLQDMLLLYLCLIFPCTLFLSTMFLVSPIIIYSITLTHDLSAELHSCMFTPHVQTSVPLTFTRLLCLSSHSNGITSWSTVNWKTQFIILLAFKLIQVFKWQVLSISIWPTFLTVFLFPTIQVKDIICVSSLHNTLQKIHSAIFSQFLLQNQDIQVTYFMSCNSNP